MAGARPWVTVWLGSSGRRVTTSRPNTISTTPADKCASSGCPFSTGPRKFSAHPSPSPRITIGVITSRIWPRPWSIARGTGWSPCPRPKPSISAVCTAKRKSWTASRRTWKISGSITTSGFRSRPSMPPGPWTRLLPSSRTRALPTTRMAPSGSPPPASATTRTGCSSNPEGNSPILPRTSPITRTSSPGASTWWWMSGVRITTATCRA